MDPTDIRLHMPRFQEDVFEENLKLVHEVTEIANKKGCTPGQLALAWILKSGGRDGLPVFVPIPGATTKERVDENSKVVDITDAEFEEVNAVLKKIQITGGRYPEGMAVMLFGDSPPEN